MRVNRYTVRPIFSLQVPWRGEAHGAVLAGPLANVIRQVWALSYGIFFENRDTVSEWLSSLTPPPCTVLMYLGMTWKIFRVREWESERVRGVRSEKVREWVRGWESERVGEWENERVRSDEWESVRCSTGRYRLSLAPFLCPAHSPSLFVSLYHAHSLALSLSLSLSRSLSLRACSLTPHAHTRRNFSQNRRPDLRNCLFGSLKIHSFGFGERLSHWVECETEGNSQSRHGKGVWGREWLCAWTRTHTHSLSLTLSLSRSLAHSFTCSLTHTMPTHSLTLPHSLVCVRVRVYTWLIFFPPDLD